MRFRTYAVATAGAVFAALVPAASPPASALSPMTLDPQSWTHATGHLIVRRPLARPAPHREPPPAVPRRTPAHHRSRPPGQEGSVSAADLLARTAHCSQISRGDFRTDGYASPSVAVCGTSGAVFWHSDLDIDCDGQTTAHCNGATDSTYQGATAVPQSDGRPLNAEELPYVVVPTPDGRWDYRESGIRGGSVAAVVRGKHVQYAVVGDTGPSGTIGEASYATARGLGVPADPQAGGTASGVTYIVFKDSAGAPVEDHGAAVRTGQRLARAFVGDGDRGEGPS